MRYNANKVTLGEVAIFKTGKLNSNAAEPQGNYPFFTCSPNIYRINSYSFNQKAILLAGNNADGNFNIKYYEEKFDAYQRTYVISVKDENIINLKYLYYSLKLCLLKFKSISQGTSTKFLTLSILNEFEIDLPDLDVQLHIEGLLSSLDDKIELNNKINDNLEQQAQAIFKSWFIDFEPFGYKMPDDWRVGKLKDVLQLTKKPTKAGTKPELPYLPIDTIPMHTFALSDFRSNSEAQSSLVTFDKDDIIIGAMRVYFHRVVIAPCAGITRTTCFVLKPYDPDYLSFALLSCNQDSSIDFAQKTSKGSTMPYAVWDGGLGDVEIAIPTANVAHEFNLTVMPMIRQIQDSYYETSALKALRDTLLPKLMSGELDVSDIDI